MVRLSEYQRLFLVGWFRSTLFSLVLFLASCGGGTWGTAGNVDIENQGMAESSVVENETLELDSDKLMRIICRPGLTYAMTIFEEEQQTYDRRLCGSSGVGGVLMVERVLLEFDDMLSDQSWRCELSVPDLVQLTSRGEAIDPAIYCVLENLVTDAGTLFQYIQLDSFVGAGGVVDQVSLEQSIEEVEGGRLPIVTVGSGIFYFERSWHITRDVSILGNGSASTFLNFLNPDTDSLVISPPEYPNYELSAEVQRGEAKLLLDVPLDLSAGAGSCPWLGGVIRDPDQPWPYDPREGLTNGELIAFGTKEGRLLEIDEPLRSSYGVGSIVSVFCPVNVTLMDFTISAEQNFTEKKVINIERAGGGGSVENVKVLGGTKAAIWVGSSRKLLIQGNEIQLLAQSGCRTCYGIQTYGAQDLFVTDNVISGTRRGIDISGTFPSRRVLVSDNVISAPSENYKALRASGLGTHGTALNTLFQRNEVRGGAVSVLIRGHDIDVVENLLLGAEIAGVYIQDGRRHSIVGNRVGGTRLSGELISRGVEYAASGGPDASLEVRSNEIEAKTCILLKSLPGNFVEFGNRFKCATVIEGEG